MWITIIGLSSHFWAAKENRVIGVCLDMLFQILGTLECLATEVTSMRLQGHMDANVRGNVVAFDDGYVAIGPSTFQVEVIGAFPTDVDFANVVLNGIRR